MDAPRTWEWLITPDTCKHKGLVFISGLCSVQILLRMFKKCVFTCTLRHILISAQDKHLCTFLTMYLKITPKTLVFWTDNLQSPPAGLTRGTSIVIHARYGFMPHQHLAHLFGHFFPPLQPPPDINACTHWQSVSEDVVETEQQLLLQSRLV